jgi:hypothetical protein
MVPEDQSFPLWSQQKFLSKATKRTVVRNAYALPKQNTSMSLNVQLGLTAKCFSALLTSYGITVTQTFYLLCLIPERHA